MLAENEARLTMASSFFFFSSRRRHTSSKRDWSSDVCSSDLLLRLHVGLRTFEGSPRLRHAGLRILHGGARGGDRRDVSEVVLDGVVELLLADRTPLGQRRVAADVELRPTLVGLGAPGLRLVLHDLRHRLLDLCLTGADRKITR